MEIHSHLVADIDMTRYLYEVIKLIKWIYHINPFKLDVLNYTPRP